MSKLKVNFSESKGLRYGENPHQQGWFCKKKTVDPLAIYKFKKLQGKKLSFNNYLDIETVINTLCFIGRKKPASVVVKHTNPCGAAVSGDIYTAFKKAWAGDSLAAFGGVIGVNRKVNKILAKEMLAEKRFFEVLVCPSISKDALDIFSCKKNLRILVNKNLEKPKFLKEKDFKKIRGGLLVQERDSKILQKKDLKTVTKKKPTKKQVKDMLFAWSLAQVSWANAIVLAKDEKMISSGIGQQDRLRCSRLAVLKVEKRAKGCAAASDGFFPFKDGPEILINAGVGAIIQPGGSIRDKETIDLCNEKGIAMVFTGFRCFRH